MPHLSVVTVTRNLIEGGRLAAFEKGFAALRAQTGIDAEQIFVDGASTDGTVALIRELLAKHDVPSDRVRLVSEPDDGIYDAMNKGAAQARGRALLFYNSDDALLDPGVLGRATAALESAGADYLYGQKVVERPDGSRRTWRRMSPRHVLHMVPFGHGALFVKTDAFRALGGFDPAYRVYADYDFMFRMIAAGYRGVAFSEPVIFFAAGGVSNTHDRLAEEFAAVWRRNVGRFVDLDGHSDTDIRGWLADKIFPDPVLQALIRGRDVPEILRDAARTCLWIGRRRRVKRLFLGRAR